MIQDLHFISPEEAGLSSENVSKFIDAVEKRRINLHSFMLVRNGDIFTEAYYKPIDEHFEHRLYSASKTFVALAIGKLVGEGKIKVTDKLIEYFPEYVTGDDPYGWLKNLTIEETLTMTIPGVGDDYGTKATMTKATSPCPLLGKDWTKAFFGKRTSWEKPNGRLFAYSSVCSNVLAELVERLSGKPLLEYMRPVFDKIGVSKNIKFITTPDGYSWGGSGVICTLRDFAKVGELVLNKGEINGEQLISKEYMEKATSKVVDIRFDSYNDYCNGYGYQIWIHPYGYAMQGMGSQFVYCFPDKKFMFVCQADTYSPNNTYEIMLYHEVVNKLYKPLAEPLEKNDVALKCLREKIESLSLLCDFGEAHSEYESKINGVKYVLHDNPMGISWFQLNFTENGGIFVYKNERGVKELAFGAGEFLDTEFPETHYYDMQVLRHGNRKQRAVACGAWTMPHRFFIRTNIIDHSIGHVGMVFEFRENLVVVRFSKWAELFLGEYEGIALGEKENVFAR